MPTIRAIIDELQSHPDADRRDILHHISNLFLERLGDHTDHESEIFGRVFVELLASLGLKDSIDFSNRFSTVSEVPSEVVLYLASNNDVAVSGPMLAHAAVLSEESLAELAELRGSDHLAAISRRPQISPSLSYTLIMRGDRAVLEAVSRNKGAAFSDDGLTQLMRRTLDFESLAQILLNRGDIPLARFERILAKAEERIQVKLAQLIKAAHSAKTVNLNQTAPKSSGQTVGEDAEASFYQDRQTPADQLTQSHRSRTQFK